MKHILTYHTLFENENMEQYTPSTKTIITGGEIILAKDKNAPLLIVYGGIPVKGVTSGVYMWNYVDKLKEKYHIFVASSHKVNGPDTYETVLTYLKKYGITPSKKVLYLFSGGYSPGMKLLDTKAADFSKVLLVDIWMKGKTISDFYIKFTNNNKSKVEYYYTSFGANNDSARDAIAKSASVVNTKSNHMDTNLLAVDSLIKMYNI
jgi:hypothetical protein